MRTGSSQRRENGEELRKAALGFSTLILTNRDKFQETADWLKRLPRCRHVGRTEDPEHQAVKDGRAYPVENLPACVHQWAFDDEENYAGIWGPICCKFFDGWDAAVYRFHLRDSDRFVDFGLADAKRIALLVALTCDRDFDGRELGLGYSWEQPAGSTSTFDGRSWAWSKITSDLGAEERLIEYAQEASRVLQLKLTFERPPKGADSVSQGPPIERRDDSPEEGYLSSRDLAKRFHVPEESLRKALQRWRRKNDKGFIESADRRAHAPTYLYSIVAVWSIVEGLRLRSKASGKASAKRPPSSP